MFVQVFEGRAARPGGLEREWQRWHDELAPGAEGWVGGTGGVSEAGELVAAVRFEAEEDARRNSDRPEQGDWWAGFSRHLEGGRATFYDCRDAEMLLEGGSDEAGFVQFVFGRTTEDRDFRETLPEIEEWLRQERPEVIGGTVGRHPGGVIQVIYFTSEEEARAGEKKQLPPRMRQAMSELVDVRYVDLRRPWLISP